MNSVIFIAMLLLLRWQQIGSSGSVLIVQEVFLSLFIILLATVGLCVLPSVGRSVPLVLIEKCVRGGLGKIRVNTLSE